MAQPSDMRARAPSAEGTQGRASGTIAGGVGPMADVEEGEQTGPQCRRPGGGRRGWPRGWALGGRQAEGSGFPLSGSSSVNPDKGSPPLSVVRPPRRSPAPAHLLAVLVVVLADVAEVGGEGLHGQGAGDLPAPPLDDHSCRDRRGIPSEPPLQTPIQITFFSILPACQNRQQGRRWEKTTINNITEASGELRKTRSGEQRTWSHSTDQGRARGR